MNKRMFLVPMVFVTIVFGCATAVGVEARSQAAEVLISSERVTITSGNQQLLFVEFEDEVEAIASADDLLLWRQDDAPQINGARLIVDGIERFSFAAPLDVEAICFKRRAEQSYDVFFGDGDGAMVHYWLSLEGEVTLQEVRRIWTNPEVEVCRVIDDSVYVDNGPLGITAFVVDEETDLTVRAVEDDFLIGSWSSASLQTEWESTDQGNFVTAAFETAPVVSGGDAADDPLILVSDYHSAWIVGTDKRWGLNAYDLEGEPVAQINRGRLNNVDGLRAPDGSFLLAASNRSSGRLDLFQADLARTSLRLLGGTDVMLNDPYGLCMGEVDDAVSVFFGGTDGVVQQWQVASDPPVFELVNTLKFDSQTEGCVVDGPGRQLFVGEEGVGIWAVDLPSQATRLVASIEDGDLVADVEGLDLCMANDWPVLVASSQGDNAFVVYKLEDGALHRLTKFKVAADLQAGIDAVSETDGLACNNQALPGYPRGVLVVQDGRNRAPEQNQNFKVVDWRQIEALLQ